jgi:cysteinyl-tRNA synthetase
MSAKYLGTRFDIHAGGVDNIYSHHESVIAQNFGAFGENPSKYWLHCRHLMFHGKKMSKSLNNTYTLSELIRLGFEPMAVKYLLLTMSYRRRLDFTFEGIEECGKKLEKFHNVIESLRNANGRDDASKIVEKARRKFESAMDDNLNTGKALRVMEEFADEVGKIEPGRESAEDILETFRIFDSVLGLGLLKPFLSASLSSLAATEAATP